MTAKAVTPEPVDPLARLRAPFADHQISKLPKETKRQTDERKKDQDAGRWPPKCNICGGLHHPKAVHLDYVGHAALTDRLLDTDSAWSWEPLAFRDGLPAFDQTGGLWIKLTVCGVTRLGYGHAATKPGMDLGAREKEVIGDALRNAAMRFGAALDLWHKGDLHLPEATEADETEKAEKPQAKAEPAKPAAVPNRKPTLAERANLFESKMRAQDTADGVDKAWKLGSGLCAELDTADPERLAELTMIREQLLDQITEAADPFAEPAMEAA